MLERLNKVNDITVYSVFSSEFSPYGRILSGYDFRELISYIDEKTGIPEIGNIYVPSVENAEKFPVYNVIKNTVFGESDIQIGYCNGRNTTYNGFEYHKSPEINIAVTDFMLVLGHSFDIKDNT